MLPFDPFLQTHLQKDCSSWKLLEMAVVILAFGMSITG